MKIAYYNNKHFKNLKFSELNISKIFKSNFGILKVKDLKKIDKLLHPTIIRIKKQNSEISLFRNS